MKTRLSVGVLLFDGFELLDVFGPLEMFGLLPDAFALYLVSEQGGAVTSAQGPRVISDHCFADQQHYDILLVPGGIGTRQQVANTGLLTWLAAHAARARYVTSVCTGSALLAKAGLLDGLRATTNKAAFDWVSSQGPDVDWIRQARWIEDGRLFTSAGVSAGMDMALALIARILDLETASKVAMLAEYQWNQDPNSDPFAKACGLV